jgi:transcriptional regulator with XRE-family HTH domain
MREEQREFARKRLDRELRFYRMAAREKHPTRELLRAVRQVLGLKVEEVARGARVNRSVIFQLEESEKRGTISLRAMVRIAEAMGCKVVYAVIPREGQTLEEMAERRKWERLLGNRDTGSENREQAEGSPWRGSEDEGLREQGTGC